MATATANVGGRRLASSGLSSRSSDKSAASIVSNGSQEIPTIHPDVLPCLKRQQLENLCARVGVRATGKVR